MSAKHVPLRRCVVCRETRPQAELLRFYQQEGRWRLDAKGKAGGRGSWLCRDKPECSQVKNLRRYFRNEAVTVGLQLQALELAALKGG